MHLSSPLLGLPPARVLAAMVSVGDKRVEAATEGQLQGDELVAPPEEAASPTSNGDAPRYADAALEALHGQIMAEIDARLNSKADSLWRRGQAELTKIHQERKQAASVISDLQSKQEALQAENARMRSALMQMTEKLEYVVLEMRDALKSLPARASQQAPGMKATPPGLTGEPLPEPTPGSATKSRWAEAGPCTPPRPASATSAAAPWSATAAGSPWAGAPPASPAGPAVRLSLATALPSAAGTQSAAGAAPQTPQAQPSGSKTLQIAECLGREVFSLELSKEPGAQGLGMEVGVSDGFSLSVGHIVEDGPVARHNARQESAERQVLLGDKIVEVNGLSHDSLQMLEECKAKPRLALKIVRETQASGAAPAQDTWALLEGGAPATGEPLGVAWKAASPGGLRAEAPAFVPSTHKEPAHTTSTPAPGLSGVPPGMECDPLAILTGASPFAGAPPAAGEAGGAGGAGGDPLGSVEVKRALFL